MIDVAKVLVKSGNGGDGGATYTREKFAPKGGPDGGDGGDGGQVFVVADPGKGTLRDYESTPLFSAESGQAGAKRQRFGQKGADIEIPVPLGTVIWEVENQDISLSDFVNRKNRGNDEHDSENLENTDPEITKLGEIIKPTDRILVAEGGLGGRGNVHFKSATNRVPLEYELGGRGQEKTLIFELKLLADVGLVGLPNAGKSTLLSVISQAKPKIADYPFTTLEPHLGVMNLTLRSGEQEQAIVADLPGLIEKASQGKGLGHQFLRHIERCRVLVYMLYVPWEEMRQDLEKQVEILFEQYQVLQGELREHNPDLLDRPFLVSVNKKDVLGDEFEQVLHKKWPEKSLVPLLFSAATHDNLDLWQERVADLLATAPRKISEITEQIPVFTTTREDRKPKLAYRSPLKQ